MRTLKQLAQEALDVQNAGLQEHLDLGLHATPPSITRGISFMMPRRRATSV